MCRARCSNNACHAAPARGVADVCTGESALQRSCHPATAGLECAAAVVPPSNRWTRARCSGRATQQQHRVRSWRRQPCHQISSFSRLQNAKRKRKEKNKQRHSPISRGPNEVYACVPSCYRKIHPFPIQRQRGCGRNSTTASAPLYLSTRRHTDRRPQLTTHTRTQCSAAQHSAAVRNPAQARTQCSAAQCSTVQQCATQRKHAHNAVQRSTVQQCATQRKHAHNAVQRSAAQCSSAQPSASTHTMKCSAVQHSAAVRNPAQARTQCSAAQHSAAVRNPSASTHTMQCSAVQHSAAVRNPAQARTQCSAAQYSAAVRNPAQARTQCSAVQRSTVQQCATQRKHTMQCSAVQCSAAQHSAAVRNPAQARTHR
jgi:hypothetical protein